MRKLALLSIASVVLVSLVAAAEVPSAKNEKGEQLGQQSATGTPNIAAISGSYYFGDGLGVNCTLVLKPEGEFSFIWRGCCGVYDQNNGKAELKGDRLLLSPKNDNKRGGFRGTPEKFLVVHWGDRIYLVADEDRGSFGILDFCNAINQGDEPRKQRHGLGFYLRDKDWDKDAPGLPDLPKEWRDYLLKQPLRGKIVQVDRKQTATVNLGSKDGLKVGMELSAQGEHWCQLEVTGIEDASCTVKHKYEDDAADEKRKLEAGQLVTSRSFGK